MFFFFFLLFIQKSKTTSNLDRNHLIESLEDFHATEEERKKERKANLTRELKNQQWKKNNAQLFHQTMNVTWWFSFRDSFFFVSFT